MVATGTYPSIAGAVFDTLVFVGGAIHGSVTVAAAVVGTTVTEVTSSSSVTALQLEKAINRDTRNDPHEHGNRIN